MSLSCSPQLKSFTVPAPIPTSHFPQNPQNPQNHQRIQPLLLKRGLKNSLIIPRFSKVEKLASKVINKEDPEDQEPEFSKDEKEKIKGLPPLIVEDEDPTYPEEDEDNGLGFKMSDFLNKFEIMSDDEDNGDDEDYSPLDDINYKNLTKEVLPVGDITAKEWQHLVFNNRNPLVLLVFERYNRPYENMDARKELEKAIKIFWDAQKPAPRVCIRFLLQQMHFHFLHVKLMEAGNIALQFDAARETDLASALKIMNTPEILFIKFGKIYLRLTEKMPAAELANIMAYIFCGSVKPESLKNLELIEEDIPQL